MLKLNSINRVMHTVAFFELAYVGLMFPLLLEPPGQTEPSDPIFFPDHISNAAPIWVRILVLMSVGAAFLIPSLWVLTVHLARSKKSGVAIGWCVIALAAVVGLEGMSAATNEESPSEWLVGSSAVAGMAIATGLYLILYSSRITSLGNVLGYELSESVDNSSRAIVFSAETRQLLGRLALFVAIVAIALAATVVLSYFPKFRDSPQYVAVGFFGVVVCGMVITGVIREETLTAIIPWAKGK